MANAHHVSNPTDLTQRLLELKRMMMHFNPEPAALLRALSAKELDAYGKVFESWTDAQEKSKPTLIRAFRLSVALGDALLRVRRFQFCFDPPPY